ncbi:CotO family spore coat protein [Halobacillus salinus]|uniref:CotO family spore coat protein n=1 Tax=Halobacillus salinus TaxID=192814 RepID=UPI0009A78761|nr:CotO family spore coat protein [Halobacillus salinus]
MAEKKRLAKQPMLYIAQPNFKPAEVPMQTSFRSQRQSKSAANSAENTSLYEKERRVRSQNAASKVEPQAEAKKEKPEEEKPKTPKAPESKQSTSTAKDRKKRFGELTLEGKVQYFLQLSPHMPKVKCEIVVNEDAYRGYIVDYKDGIVQMKTFQRPFQKDIPFKEIEDIRLLGF